MSETANSDLERPSVADVPADPVLVASEEFARDALAEITPLNTIGKPVGYVVEGEHLLSLLFEAILPGYPGWRWTVTLSRIDEASEPTVLETELMPGDHALLAPPWLPWADRLADYNASQESEEDADTEDAELDRPDSSNAVLGTVESASDVQEPGAEAQEPVPDIEEPDIEEPDIEEPDIEDPR